VCESFLASLFEVVGVVREWLSRQGCKSRATLAGNRGKFFLSFVILI